MASAEFVDPYLDSETGVLHNRIGARTKVALDRAEGDLVFARLVQLMDDPAPSTGDLAELRVIHRRLFCDVYEWAGQVRTVDIRKNAPGAEFFLPVSMIERAAGYAADELRAEDMLRGLDRDQFVERLAYHYDQINYLYPFREGNGRTQRVFWNRIARDAGWQLDWRDVQGETNDAACRAASERGDFAPLREMFDQIATAVASTSERGPGWQASELARLSFPTSAGARGAQSDVGEPGRPDGAARDPRHGAHTQEGER